MSVNSVLPGLPPSYGALSDVYSQTRKTSRLAGGLPDTASAAQQPKSPAVDNAGYGSQLEQELRASTATAESTGSESSGWRGRPTAAAIGLYQRVNQIGQEETAPSALLKRWNSIVQSEQDGSDSQVAQQNSTTRFESGILDLTA